MDYVIYFAITIGILVFVHELGHFLAAKICKMRANVFALGFGKRLFGWNKINGFTLGALPEDLELGNNTDYRFSMLPLGGYVKISGMVDESFDTEFAHKEPQPYEFRSKPTYQKLFVITAGVMMNVTLTLVIFAAINFFQGKEIFKTTKIGNITEENLAYQAGFRSFDKVISISGDQVDNFEQLLNKLHFENIGEEKEIVVERAGKDTSFNIAPEILKEATKSNNTFYLPLGETKPWVTSVNKNSPAGDAGLQNYDIILDINGIILQSSSEVQKIISSHKDIKISMALLRNGDTMHVSVVPGLDGKIGIGLNEKYIGEKGYISYSIFEASGQSMKDVIQSMGLMVTMVRGIAAGYIEVEDAIGGPGRIAQYAARSAEMGLVYFLKFLAVLSLNLAILNILPFPVLDGGHLVIILIEGIIRKELPIKLKIAIQNAGFIILLILMAFIIYYDIINF